MDEQDTLEYTSQLDIFPKILCLVFQNLEKDFWVKNKSRISLLLNITAIFTFVISMQPYAATLMLVYFVIKVMLMTKR